MSGPRMRRLLAAVALVVIATTLPPAPARARPPARLMCAVWTGGFHLVPRLRPKRCEIPVESPVKLSAMVWRDWGEPYAKSRASIALDDGTRTRGTVTVNFAGDASPGERADVMIESATSTTLRGAQRAAVAA